MKDSAIDMPANFTPEAVAPIIRFMYTGKIELKESSYEKLRETAETLQVSCLSYKLSLSCLLCRWGSSLS